MARCPHGTQSGLCFPATLVASSLGHVDRTSLKAEREGAAHHEQPYHGGSLRRRVRQDLACRRRRPGWGAQPL